MSKLETNTIDNISGSSTLTIGSTNTTTVSIPEDVTLGASGKTITIPSGATITNSGTATGFGETNTPYFLATLSGDQDIGYTGVWNKISMNSEIHDSAGAYDTSNYRFTPQTAGKYFVFSTLQFEATAGSNQTPQYKSAIYKNGSTIGNSVMWGSSNMRQFATFFGRIINMDGSSDYLEAYGLADGTGAGSNRIAAGVASSSFGAYFIAT